MAQLTGRKDRQKKETSLFTMPPHLHRGNLSTRISTQGLGSADFYFLPHTLCCLCYSHTQPKHVNFPHARNRTDYSQILVFLIGEILLLKLFHLKLFGERSTEIKSTTTSKDRHSTEGGSRLLAGAHLWNVARALAERVPDTEPGTTRRGKDSSTVTSGLRLGE